MSKDDSTSLYSCWQNLFHFSKKANQENNNMKRTEEISASKSISLEEIISTTTISKFRQTGNLKKHVIHVNLKKKVSCKNSMNNDENFKILRQDYAAYSNTNLHMNEKNKSSRFEKGDFGKHFKYPKVYALYKTVSGLRICLRENCTNSSKFHKEVTDSDGKCVCPHCGAMAVVTESLKHPVTFDYNLTDNPSKNPHREKRRKKYVQRKCSLLQHPSFINVVTKLKALENRTAQLEAIISRNGHQYNMEADEVQQSKQFVKRFDIPTSELRSEKYRRKKQLEALNNYSKEEKISLPLNNTSQITKTDNYIKEVNLNENKSKSAQTHSTIQNETYREKSTANSSKFRNTNSAKENVSEKNKIETLKTNVDIKKKSMFEINRDKYKQNKSAHVERSTITESNKPSTYSIANGSMSCWSNFKSKFLQGDKSNDTNKIVQIFKSKRTGSEISSQKSGKNITGNLRSVTNSDRYSSYNTSYQNMMCQTYNKIYHDINRESLNCSQELKPSEISNTINKVKTHPKSDINYKELLNATAKKPLELNKLVTLSHEEKTQLLLEKMQNLEDINKKMNMMQYHYEEEK